MHLFYRLFLAFIFVTSSKPALSCPMCFTRDNKTAVDAYLATTFAMIILFFTLLGTVVYFIWKRVKENEKISRD